MSKDASGPPSKKKQKQVSLGSWLSQTGAKSNGIRFEGSSPNNSKRTAGGGNNTGSHGCSGSRDRGTADGGDGGSADRDPWAKYEPAASSRRTSVKGEGYAQPRYPPHPQNAYNKLKGAGAPIVHPPAASPASTASPRVCVNRKAGGEGGSGEDNVVCLGVPKTSEAFVLPEGMDEIMADLCEEQRHVVELILRGQSVFFTGAAGTGKSFLLKKLHQALQHVGKGSNTFMTGTTGKAAVGIGGCTIHSFAGIGMGKEPVEELLGRVQRGRQSQKRWGECQVLVIDEISMMEADLFDKLNLIGQRMKGNAQPFGGIQLVLCGDFFQLPPVGIGRGTTRFCFEARTWDTALDHSIVLKQVFRQKDPLFLNILHEMREGRVSEDAKRILTQKVQEYRGRQRALESGRAGGVDSSPKGSRGVGSSESTGESDWGKCDGGGGGAEEDGRGGAESGGGRDKEKEMTFVRLFSKNEDVDRLNEHELKRLEGTSEFFQSSDSGEPAYLTQLQKHCAAPATVELKVGAKVLLLKNLDSSSQLVNGATGVVIEFADASGRKLPKVEFDPMEGNGRTVSIIREEEWTVSLGQREMARRTQLPLRLAWALSVHKSQGMTIPHVMVSTVGMFEFGQAYVALSRATTLDGLLLVDFEASRVKAHHKVKAFYRGLEERARGGPSTAVTAVPRQGQAPKPAGAWISRSDRSMSHPGNRSAYVIPRPQQQPLTAPSSAGQRSSTWAALASTAPAVSTVGAGLRAGGVLSNGGMSAAARERMETNRKRALEKLAETRSRALEASAALARWGRNPGSGGSR